jgi:LuxR family maltose regulon positive regulatory protein
VVTIRPLQLLVPAKVAPPRHSAALVPRERLLERLSGHGRARLTLVVAPAGFGKSTLVAQWVRRAPHPVAWLTLDEHDQDSVQFLAYVAGAIERVIPGALPMTRPLLAAPEPPPIYVLLQALLVDLSALPAGVTLVLDDYHTISAEPVHQAVAYLLRQLPASCRLVVLSRADPPLQLARLRAERQLVEVRSADLRFTDGEAAALVATLLGRAPDGALVAALQAETEGWAIALQLAALTALESASPPRTLRAAGPLAEYLAEEVLLRQPPQTQAALLALAVPERVCAGLAAALLGAPDDQIQAEHLLEQLVHANLLLVPLDGAGGWYRFHHLFRDLLLRQLHLSTGQGGVAELELRAARWLERGGLYAEAVRAYLAAGAEDAAGALIERLLAPDLGRSLTPVRPAYWLRLLPEPLVNRRPGLALLGARIGFATLNIPALAAGLVQVEALLAAPGAADLDPPWPTFPADLTLLRAVLAYVQRRLDVAIPALESVLDVELGLGLTGQALLVLGRAYVAAGRYEEGVRRMEARRAGPLPLQARLSHAAALCAMHGLAGSLDDLDAEAARLASMVEATNAGDTWICSAAANLGRAAFERSDLPAAARHFVAVIERRYQANAAVTIGALIGLALIAAHQGDLAGADEYARDAQALAAEVGSPFARNEARGCVARLALQQGDLATALQAAAEIAPDPQLGSSSWYALELPQLTRASVLIAAGGEENWRAAEALVADVQAQVEGQHNVRPLVCALAVSALLSASQGREDAALEALARAVSLAAPRGYLRALTDRGPALRPLLRSLAARGHEPAYVARVLAALDPAPRGSALARPEAPAGLDALTSREMEVLALLAERWTDKEIAARLVITPNTVRKHTTTLYDKLGVSNRRAAVEAARALGILPVAVARE